MALISGRALDGTPSRVTLGRAEGPTLFQGKPVEPARVTGTFRTTSLDGIGMVEHLFAALAGLGLYRGVSIEVEGRALPIVDGAAGAWADALQGFGSSPPKLRVRKNGVIEAEGSRATFEIGDSIDIGVALANLPGEASWQGARADFLERIAPARMFFFESDVDTMLRGGVRAEIDPANVILVRDGEIVGGAPDEPARHKLLDLLGDLFVWGGPPIGKMRVHKPGHTANHALVRAAISAGILAVLLFFASPARGEPPLERPPTLPELTHPGVDLVVEHTIAGVALQTRQTAITFHRFAFDVPLVPRQWFFTGEQGLTVGNGPDGHPAAAPTNTQLGLRAAWSSLTGLGFGGGIALVIPTSSIPNGTTAATTLGEAASIRAWDRPLFEPETFALRPFVDLRSITGHFTIQFRQTLDMVASGRSAIPLEESYRIAAVAILYVGYRINDWLAAGSELIERYDMDSTTPDTDRPRFAISGSLRAMTRYFQPAITVTTGLGSPLNAFSTIGAPLERSPTAFVAMRIGLVFTGFDPPW